MGSFHQSGFAVVEQVLTSAEIDLLSQALILHLEGGSVRQRGGIAYAARNLTELVPAVRQLACSQAVRSLVEPVLGPDAFAVRSLLFDKTPEANWKVPWHQDLNIAVRKRVDAPGFGPWSIKAGVPHVEPPVQVLEGMLTVRLHVDECRAENGALRVIPGSHRWGRLSDAQIQEQRAREEVTCEVPRGGALLMRPLLLHASSPAAVPCHRRVVHLEFAATDLPTGVEWYQRVS